MKVTIKDDVMRNKIESTLTRIELIKSLQQENKQLKEIEKEHQKINGELREENKKLKEVIEKVREYINSKVISNGEIIDQLRKIEVKELLQILDKGVNL